MGEGLLTQRSCPYRAPRHPRLPPHQNCVVTTHTTQTVVTSAKARVRMSIHHERVTIIEYWYKVILRPRLLCLFSMTLLHDGARGGVQPGGGGDEGQAGDLEGTRGCPGRGRVEAKHSIDVESTIESARQYEYSHCMSAML